MSSNSKSSECSSDGIQNPAGVAFLGIAPPIFIAAVPLSFWLTQPNGSVEKLLNSIVRTTVYVGSAGSTSNVSTDRAIPALSALYMFLTYGLGGASSAAAIDMGTKGRDSSRKIRLSR